MDQDINIISCIVIVGGFRSQAAQHANIDGGKGFLMATDFVRAALGHQLFQSCVDKPRRKLTVASHYGNCRGPSYRRGHGICEWA